jgi:hypothetical protein
MTFGLSDGRVGHSRIIRREPRNFRTESLFSASGRQAIAASEDFRQVYTIIRRGSPAYPQLLAERKPFEKPF